MGTWCYCTAKLDRAVVWPKMSTTADKKVSERITNSAEEHVNKRVVQCDIRWSGNDVCATLSKTIPMCGAEKSVCGDFACSGKAVRFRTRVPMLNIIVLVSTTSPQRLYGEFWHTLYIYTECKRFREQCMLWYFACSRKTVRFRTWVPMLNLSVLVHTTTSQSL